MKQLIILTKSKLMDRFGDIYMLAYMILMTAMIIFIMVTTN